jgi:lysophospholipase L1-like esterase
MCFAPARMLHARPRMASISMVLAGLGLLAAILLPGSRAGAAAAPRASAASGCAATHWVGTWAADPSDGSGPGYDDQTLRVIVTPHYPGNQLRVHLSNRFGTSPVTFGSASIGHRAGGAGVVGATNRPITFNGSTQVTVAPGTDVVSDPVSLTFKSFQELTVSVYVSGDVAASTEHVAGDETSYSTTPNTPDATAVDEATPFTMTTTRTSFVDGLDVLAPGSISALVGVGDSITDGIESFVVPATQSAAIDANSRYTDDLSRRLGSKSKLSIVNAGISGNQLLDDVVPEAGPSGLSRLQNDVLDVPGVSDVIIEEGINDLGQGRSAADLEAGLTSAVSQLHAAGLNVLVGTIMPVGGVVIPSYAAPEVEVNRQAVNDWLRTGASGADGIVDFDGALRNPASPSALLPKYDSGDHVHPSNAGYRAMSDAVDPALIRGASCSGSSASAKVPTTLRFHVASHLAGGVRLNGRLYAAAPSAQCVGGHVTLSEVTGTRTTVHRVARLYQHCAFAATLAVPAGQTVTLEARYAGNALLGASHAKALRVRR